MTITDPRFWDCNCQEKYIHANCVNTWCIKCNTQENEQPDSMINEILKGLQNGAGQFTSDIDYGVALGLSETEPLNKMNTYRYQIQLFLEDNNNSNGPYNLQKNERPSPNCIVNLYNSNNLENVIKRFEYALSILQPPDES